MSRAGYSGTSLPSRLGLRPGMQAAWIGAPAHFSDLVAPLPDGVRVKARAIAPLDVVVLFVTRRAELTRRLPALRTAVAPAGAVWAAWPKGTSGVATDVTENVVRDVALPLGLVDVKVCAIDDTWSGLRLVIRKELR